MAEDNMPGTWCVRVYLHDGTWTEEPADSPAQAGATAAAAVKKAETRRVDLVLIDGEGEYVPQQQQYHAAAGGDDDEHER